MPKNDFIPPILRLLVKGQTPRRESDAQIVGNEIVKKYSKIM